MGRTMHTVLEGPANALDLCKDCSKVVVAGRSVFKIYSIEDDFVERDNLRVGKNINLNFSCNDVVWSPIDDQLIATAATNGAVVVWNLNKSGRSKQEQVFTDHKRTVNKVNFHPTEAGLLISGSQDGTMKLFDMRMEKLSETFHSNTESVRDVQFNPHAYWQFSAVSENGKIQLWDIRRPDRCEKQWPAHNNHVFACDWHPEVRNMLATAGRDKTIKVWDTVCKKGDKMHGLEHTIHTIGPVGRVKWRPQRRDYLGSSALCIDFAVNVWDIRRPYVPFAAFNHHKDVTTDIAWRGDPHTLLSTSKDGTLYQHTFNDAVRPGDKANPVGLSFNVEGDVTHAHRYVPRNSHHYGVLPASKSRGGVDGQAVFRKHVNHTELFRMCTSRLIMHQPPPSQADLGIETVVRETARRYRLHNTSLAEACDINAGVARSLGRNQVALTWTILKTLYACNKSDVARPVSGDLSSGTGEVVEGGDRTKLRLRSASGVNRRVSGKMQSLKVVSHGGGREAVTAAKDGTSESEEEEEQSLDNCQTLTEIASGYTVATITGDFFGDSELAGLGVEGLVSLEGGGGGGGGNQQIIQEWVLPSEAFEQRHEIKDGEREEDLVVGEAENGEATMQTVTVEDKTSAVVVWGVHAQDTRPSWSPGLATSQALCWLAEQGDVQNAVSMYIALAGGRTPQGDRVKGLVDKVVLEHWWLSYVELLQKLQLFTKANEILSQCSLAAVHTLNQQSTTVYTACTKCGKGLGRSGGAWWCDRCRAPPARCAVCHAVVRGLFVWCQGCGHGGHINHIGEWFEKRTSCPAGCGHHCQYH